MYVWRFKTVDAHCKLIHILEALNIHSRTANMHTSIHIYTSNERKHNKMKREKNKHSQCFECVASTTAEACVNIRLLCSQNTTLCGTLINKSLCTAFLRFVQQNRLCCFFFLLFFHSNERRTNFAEKKK